MSYNSTYILYSIIERFCATDAENIVLRVCGCCPAASQLLAHGLFPSAPKAPTLAFDLYQLRFYARYSLVSPPNLKAWSGTLSSMLRGQGFIFKSKKVCQFVSLSACFVWHADTRLRYRVICVDRLGNHCSILCCCRTCLGRSSATE